MSKNIILKTINEVKYFHRRILFAITLKEKVTFLILSNDIIFDIETLRNYLIENELNHFAKNEIINLIELIDSFLKFEKSHNEIPKSENHFSYEYPNKGKGVGGGNLMYVLKVNDQFLKTNEATFNEKEPLYSKLTSLKYFNISSRLLEIKDLFATFLEQPQQPEAPQKNQEIKEYLQSYKHSCFSSVINKQDNNKQDNILFYGKVTADVLEKRNKHLLSNEILKERTNLLSNYNKRLYYLTGHTMQLFKAVNDYSNTTNSGYLTKIKINEDEVFSSLSEIKEVAKVIKHNIINDENHIAQKIKDYCILMFDDCIDLLNKRFGVDIYKSPLNTHFENVKQEFVNSINYEQLKIINELSKNIDNTPQKTITQKPNEIYKNQNLFKVGLLFATGKMNKFFTVTNKDKTVMKEGFSAPKIAEELENSSYNKYILASINNYTDKENKGKNIFYSRDMMTKVISHCKAENLPIDTYFESRLPIE